LKKEGHFARKGDSENRGLHTITLNWGRGTHIEEALNGKTRMAKTPEAMGKILEGGLMKTHFHRGSPIKLVS